MQTPFPGLHRNNKAAFKGALCPQHPNSPFGFLDESAVLPECCGNWVKVLTVLENR